jgi:hypothetical protein
MPARFRTGVGQGSSRMRWMASSRSVSRVCMVSQFGCSSVFTFGEGSPHQFTPPDGVTIALERPTRWKAEDGLCYVLQVATGHRGSPPKPAVRSAATSPWRFRSDRQHTGQHQPNRLLPPSLDLTMNWPRGLPNSPQSVVSALTSMLLILRAVPGVSIKSQRKGSGGGCQAPRRAVF